MTNSKIFRYMILFALFAAMSSTALAGGRPLSAELFGDEEIHPGDPDGGGEVFMTLNSGQRKICYQMSVWNISPAFGAHIHEGSFGSNGPVVVGLLAPTDGFSSACVSAGRDLIKAIRKNPQNYYINVHNAEFPPGAIRGQLSK